MCDGAGTCLDNPNHLLRAGSSQAATVRSNRVQALQINGSGHLRRLLHISPDADIEAICEDAADKLERLLGRRWLGKPCAVEWVFPV